MCTMWWLNSTYCKPKNETEVSAELLSLAALPPEEKLSELDGTHSQSGRDGEEKKITSLVRNWVPVSSHFTYCNDWKHNAT
jgi:hypothetical protein